MSYYISRKDGFIQSALSCPPSPANCMSSASSDIYIPAVVFFNLTLSNSILVPIPYSYNFKTSKLSTPLSLFSLQHFPLLHFTPSHFSLIHIASLLLLLFTQPNLYPSITYLSSMSSNIHDFFFPVITCHPLALLSSLIFLFFLSHPPSCPFCHLPRLFFLTTSCPLFVLYRFLSSVYHYTSTSIISSSLFLSLVMLPQRFSSA